MTMRRSSWSRATPGAPRDLRQTRGQESATLMNLVTAEAVANALGPHMPALQQIFSFYCHYGLGATTSRTMTSTQFMK